MSRPDKNPWKISSHTVHVPPQVVAVDAVLRNIFQTYEQMPQNVDTSFKLDEGPNGTWIISDNYERSPHLMVYKVDEGKWYYRDKWDGTDKPMKHGFSEAVNNALAWWG
tara:strand:- start:145 stop:471 length:327 start_codon:yes stop_codon:yes gene_type:complete